MIEEMERIYIIWRLLIEKLFVNLNKFDQKGKVTDSPRSRRLRSSGTYENADITKKNPCRSAKRFSPELGIPRTSLGRILHEYMNTKPIDHNYCLGRLRMTKMATLNV